MVWVTPNEYKLTGGPLRGRSPARGTSVLSDGLALIDIGHE
jgi:hypothetical protein